MSPLSFKKISLFLLFFLDSRWLFKMFLNVLKRLSFILVGVLHLDYF